MTTATTVDPPAARPSRDLSPRARARRRRLAVVGVVLALALGFLLYKALTSAIVYFKTAAQAVQARTVLGNSTFQIEGVVVCGSVHSYGQRLDHFTIASGSTHVVVENTGIPPQLFEGGVPVVLVGHFVGTGDVFSSDQILVKHSNSYVAAHPSRVRTPKDLLCTGGSPGVT